MMIIAYLENVAILPPTSSSVGAAMSIIIRNMVHLSFPSVSMSISSKSVSVFAANFSSFLIANVMPIEKIK